ncbi:E3 ubiquitin-protein ligase TRIM9-like isoform X2 [Macrobrachium nipponense]|uniref:E3 ubiquitin-protein ligase TRIM9-like isoform X2 n=1 Tax=Macrobrachium nipponense TaxID=159736 RepID=UPI0030C8B6CF
MEEELRCAVCANFFTEPVLLPCLHALCLKCACGLQRGVQALLAEPVVSQQGGPPGHDPDPPDGGADSDKASVYSETDSGVVVASRPTSYVSSPENTVTNAEGGSEGQQQQGAGGGGSGGGGGGSSGSGQQQQQGVRCPVCLKVSALGPGAAADLPRYTAMARIIARHRGDPGTADPPPPPPTATGGTPATLPPCQLCEGPPRPATTECQQCQVLYCGPCLTSCHPPRGPLATHTLGPVTPLGGVYPGAAEVCAAHGERPSLYCLVCRWSGCRECGPSHSQHDLQPLDNLAKTHKAELSESLQQLSGRAKATHAHITNLKTFQDRVNAHCDTLAAEVERQCAELLEAVHTARTRLLAQLAAEREATTKIYRDQASGCTRRLHQTTALVQFCIEAIKEPDPAAFMQMGPQLIGRVSDLDLTWDKELTSSSTRLSPYIDLDVDHKSVLRAINTFNFVQMKPPGPPEFLAEECVGENNSVTATWSPHPTSRVAGYILEIDDGDGDFKEVHRGPETLCTVEGLHFNTVYHLRVKAYNISGVSPYSSPVSIRTSATAWFSLDRTLSHPECRLVGDGAGVTCESYEHRVALASVGFSRGRHYWQFTVDSYDANADVVFGVARINVDKEGMLGNDVHGWAMYIDHQRSWFLHGAAHHGRCDGGVGVGSTVGVLLDLNHRTLTFYVNDEQQGDVAFTDLDGLFYPAVSVNRNVTVTLHTSLDPPHSDYDSQSDT